ncbi:MAG: Gfo/Idh/MocA family protein, partial [Planctomycetota bacterium]
MSSQDISVGIVGGGRVGLSFIRFLQKQRGVRVTGVVTRSEKRQKELAETYNIAACSSVTEMMNSQDKPQVVCVVNANEDHAPATIEALEGGAHVYLEKPMAPTLAECEQIVEAEKRSGQTLQVGFEYIHGTMTSRLRQLVGEGYFGDVVWASVLDSRGHWWSIDPQADASELWKLDRSRGGGIIFHCGIHQLDLIRHYLGPIEQVT